MNRLKAESKIKRKSTRLKPCPFCGKIPELDIKCDRKHSEHGSWGHYAIRKSCCDTTGSGQTELFFCNDFKKPNFKLWWSMSSRLIDDWNKRAAL